MKGGRSRSPFPPASAIVGDDQRREEREDTAQTARCRPEAPRNRPRSRIRPVFRGSAMAYRGAGSRPRSNVPRDDVPGKGRPLGPRAWGEAVRYPAVGPPAAEAVSPRSRTRSTSRGRPVAVSCCSRSPAGRAPADPARPSRPKPPLGGPRACAGRAGPIPVQGPRPWPRRAASGSPYLRRQPRCVNPDFIPRPYRGRTSR